MGNSSRIIPPAVFELPPRDVVSGERPAKAHVTPSVDKLAA